RRVLWPIRAITRAKGLKVRPLSSSLLSFPLLDSLLSTSPLSSDLLHRVILSSLFPLSLLFSSRLLFCPLLSSLLFSSHSASVHFSILGFFSISFTPRR